MRLIGRSLFSTCILAICCPKAALCEPASFWNHNGSVMALYAVGDGRVFRYQEPRIGMQQEGVVAGTVRFQGTKTGNSYSGTAFVFSRRCGARPFQVRGTASEDEREINLHGNAPAGFDAACRPTVYSKHVVNFTFLRSVNSSVVADRDQSAAETAVKRAGLEEPQATKENEEQRLRDLREQQDRQARDLREQQERAERISREREQEQRRLAEVRAFASHRDGCAKYDAGACDIALLSSRATQQDMIDLRNWRSVAEKLRADLDRCRTGSVAACDAALSSPAIADEQRPQLSEWRVAASPFERAKALISKPAGMAMTALRAGSAAVRNLPTSVHVTGGLAAVVALALAAMAFRRRHAPSRGGARPPASSAPRVAASTWNRAGSPIGWLQDLLGRSTRLLAAIPASARRTVPDTPGAIAALERAHVYIAEVREAETPKREDHALRKSHLNALALATRQLDAAQKLDPDAVLEGQEKEYPGCFSINELKAQALLLEGITLHAYDVKRATTAFCKATNLDPNNAYAFFVLGLTHAANKNTTAAVAALQRAVALRPTNVTYCKELERAQSLHASAVPKATRIPNAAVKTAMAGVVTAAATWKIVVFSWRVLARRLAVAIRSTSGAKWRTEASRLAAARSVNTTL